MSEIVQNQVKGYQGIQAGKEAVLPQGLTQPNEKKELVPTGLFS